jgi:hypothetical protein
LNFGISAWKNATKLFVPEDAAVLVAHRAAGPCDQKPRAVICEA